MKSITLNIPDDALQRLARALPPPTNAEQVPPLLAAINVDLDLELDLDMFLLL